MAKGDNMKPPGQRKTVLRRLTNHKDGETAMLAAIMFALVDEDLSAGERAMWEQAFQHHTRRIKFGEPFQVEKKENGLNLFAGEGA
jgi:hypothetical protein